MNLMQEFAQDPVLRRLCAAEEVIWENPGYRHFSDVRDHLPLGKRDIEDASARLARFAPFIETAFPETAPLHGLIESPLTDIPGMKQFLNKRSGAVIKGRLLLKRDSDLAVSGSVKARGGIYEVLKHSEEIARSIGLLKEDYTVFASRRSREIFSRYAIHVGSTGNLGLSIGIISAALGFRAYVHMSSDARKWKKDLLRSKGVTVIEYDGDYSKAVADGRKAAGEDPDAYFVDDENSKDLFLGYAVAAKRLKKQLDEKEIRVDADHPLFVYIPCGVGGAPGGIAFGLKYEFGDLVHPFFIEPVQAPSMLLAMSTGLYDAVSVLDAGLTGKTAADGLAVGRASGFVSRTAYPFTAGIMTVQDEVLFDYLAGLYKSERLFIEPSACAAFRGPEALHLMHRFLSSAGLTEQRLDNGCHIVWATGGKLVPEQERARDLKGSAS